MPVLAALIAATGVDPILLVLPVAMAASWGFMLPSGPGPNALAWATGHIALPRILKAGPALDIIGVPLLIGVLWAIAITGGTAHHNLYPQRPVDGKRGSGRGATGG